MTKGSVVRTAGSVAALKRRVPIKPTTEEEFVRRLSVVTATSATTGLTFIKFFHDLLKVIRAAWREASSPDISSKPA